MFDYDYDGAREDARSDARYERGDSYRYRYHCDDGMCGASDCGECRNGDPEEADDEAEPEPEAGDRVTVENVADLPVGTVVGWRMLGEEWTATKRGPDEWHVPGSSLPAPYSDDGVRCGEPTFILSIPAEVSRGA